MTGSGGVAQTWLVRLEKWAPADPETTGYIIPPFYRYADLAGDADARAHEITGEQRYLAAAIRNGEWALTQAHANGWLENNCLQNNEQPFTHTIAYAMRGLLEIGIYAERQDFIDAATKIGDAMIAALPADGDLPGRFDSNWRNTLRWSCLTGDCQLAINWGRLWHVTGRHSYAEAISQILTFVKRT